MLSKKLKDYQLILASKSPRRQYLLNELGLDFEVKIIEDIEESYPEDIKTGQIPIYLAEIKSNSFNKVLQEDQLLITADTVVILNGSVIGKPKDKNEAVSMLNDLSGKKHKVVTGVCIKTTKKTSSFSASTNVFFSKLRSDEINYYIEQYKPYDKAGSYGIQEWIGYIGVEKIEGSYFNVMGLPVQRLYTELLDFLK